MVRTLNDAYLDLKSELKKAGISGSQIEARDLVCHAMEIPREEFYARRNMMIFDKDTKTINDLRDLRLSGTPVQHITGMWEFYGLDMEVSTDTLIPRADTETLAKCGINFMQSRDKGRMLDLCCGCGRVGIAVLKNVSDGITGVFADKSEPALQLTRKNLVRHKLTARALTINADATCQPPDAVGKYNLIVCNPPYIPTAEIASLDEEVKREPLMALDGGADGLDFYRAICKNYRQAITKGGALMFEVGLGQCVDVMTIMKSCGYVDVRFENDLTGIERVVWGNVK